MKGKIKKAGREEKTRQMEKSVFFTYSTSNVSSTANDITLVFFNPFNNPMSYTIPMQRVSSSI